MATPFTTYLTRKAPPGYTMFRVQRPDLAKTATAEAVADPTGNVIGTVWADRGAFGAITSKGEHIKAYSGGGQSGWHQAMDALIQSAA